MRWMLSTMSVREIAGSWLEGTPAIPMHIGTKARLFDRFGQEIDGVSQDLSQSTLQPGNADQPDAGGRIEVHDKVDIAIRGSLAACERSEQGGVQDAGSAQLRFMRAKCRDDTLG